VLEPIKKKSLYQEAARRIQDGIETGIWAPGTRLPSERELARALNVGRSSIREAIRVLQAIDLIEIRPGDGTYVKQQGSPLNEESLRFLLQDKEVSDLYEVRELLDVQIAAMAAERATPEDIQVIESTLECMADGIRAGRPCVNEDYQYHKTLARIVDNQVLLQIQEMLWKSLWPTVERFLQVPGRLERSLVEHRAVLDAIKDGDTAKSRELMHAHLQSRFTDPGVAKVFQEYEKTPNTASR